MIEAPYAHLTPDLVLDAVAACGLWPDGRLLALNSYENRVWQVGIEDVVRGEGGVGGVLGHPAIIAQLSPPSPLRGEGWGEGDLRSDEAKASHASCVTGYVHMSSRLPKCTPA